MSEVVRRRTPLAVLIALFAVLSCSMVIGGYLYYRKEARGIQAHRYSELRAIAALKIDQIVFWRNERLGDVRLAASGSAMNGQVIRWLAHPVDTRLKGAITRDLTLIRDTYGYQNAMLLGLDGRLMLSLDPRLTMTETEVLALSAQVIREQRAIMGDLFRCPDCGQAHLDVAAPVLDAGGKPLAVVLLRSNPETLLYPLIQSWPTPSETAETLLVRREGEKVLFLNRLRHRSDPALTLMVPISGQDLPATQAVLGKTGEFFGHDYRGVEVLADLRPVPGSRWFMVAKVDTREILAEARYRGRFILGFTGMGILMIGALFGFLFYFGQAKLYQEMFQATRFGSAAGSAVENARVQRSRNQARSLGFISIAVGCLVLAGWTLDIAALKGIFPGFVTMKVNTAIGFLVAGTALSLQTWTPKAWPGARICAGILVLLGGLTLLQYLFGLDFRIDQLLFREPAGMIGTLSPGRMAPASALNFTLLGWALILASFKRTTALAQWFALPVGIIGLLALLGQLYGPIGIYGIGHYLQLALHTAVSFFLLSLGLLLLNPVDGFMRRFMAETMGGWLLRHTVLFIPGVSILIGWVRAVGEQRGWYESSVGVALIVTTFVILMLTATWWAARSLDRIDSIRSQAEARVRESAEEIRATLYGIGDGVIATDSGGRVLHMNPVAERLTGWEEREAVGKILEDVFRIINEETEAAVENPVVRVLREGQVIGLANHTLLIAKDGVRRAIADSGAPVFGDQGDINRVVLVFRDQTAERAAQRALSESETKYRRLHESMRDAYALADMNGRILEYNRLYQEMLGYADEELEQLTYQELTPPEWRDIEARIIQEQVLPLGYSQVYEKTYRRKNGTVFPVELRTNLLTGDHGEPIGMWALIRDISERTQAEQVLRETQERLKFALDGSNDGWWDVRMDTRAVHLSPRTCEMLGYLPEDGDRIAQEWSHLVHPDDLANTRSALNDYLMGSTSLFSVEQRLRTASGAWKWVLARGKSVAWSPEGASLRMVGTHRDISDRKQAEDIIHAKTELLNLTGRMARVGGWEFDTGTFKGTWTDEVARIHDLDDVQEMDAKQGMTFYDEPSRPKIQQAVMEAIELGKPYDLELGLISAKGVRKIIRTVGNPVRNEDGKVIKVLGILQDITEMKAAEDKIRDARAEAERLLEIADQSRRALLSLVEDQKVSEEEIRRLNADLEVRVHTRTRELESANKELEAFAYSVSHDLRAPLRHMDGFLSMLARHMGDGLDAKGAHFLEVAQRASVRMGQLVDGLLSFSRLGKAELRVMAINTDFVVASVIEEFKEECAGRSIRWQVGPLPGILGDPTLVRLVFQNLVGNALKFTRNQSETLIEIQSLDGLSEETGVMIRDNGVGFEPAYSHKLFGVFQRLHREEEFEGTGIGLANVHRIISRHGGRVWAEAHPGQGAAFFITFPIQGRTS